MSWRTCACRSSNMSGLGRSPLKSERAMPSRSERTLLFYFLSLDTSFYLFSVSIIFIYIYLCCDDFPLYVTCEFSISVFHINTLLTAKYSMILQKNLPSLIIPFFLCLYLARLFLFPTMEKRCPHHLSRTFSLVSRSFLLPLVRIRHIFR